MGYYETNNKKDDDVEKKKKLIKSSSSSSCNVGVNDCDSPFMNFLKAAIPLGGLRIIEVRRLIEERRKYLKDNTASTSNNSKAFSHELAYIMECSDSGTIENAKSILQLYIDSSTSLNLAVAYAERNHKYSKELWQTLVHHCIKKAQQFGELLESAALYGANISEIIKQIPTEVNLIDLVIC